MTNYTGKELERIHRAIYRAIFWADIKRMAGTFGYALLILAAAAMFMSVLMGAI